jgi:ribonuclease-3
VTTEPDPIHALGGRLGHAFRDAALLEQALTHSSFANEHAGTRDNGALAFLGDAVLALIVGEHLWRAFPDEPEGVLTPKRAELVSGANLCRWAVAIHLGPHLCLGRGEELMGGREKESLLATALEAVLAVVYLEGGLDASRRAVASLALW